METFIQPKSVQCGGRVFEIQDFERKGKRGSFKAVGMGNSYPFWSQSFLIPDMMPITIKSANALPDEKLAAMDSNCEFELILPD
jgi:hypothetical protein